MSARRIESEHELDTGGIIMSDQWGQPPQQGAPGQQPYYQGQPGPTQPMAHPGQVQQPPGPYAHQHFAAAPAPSNTRKRPVIIGGIAALAVIGGALGIYFAVKPSGSSQSVRTASTAGISPTATGQSAPAAGAQTSSATAGDSSDLLTTNQVCPAFLAIEQPLISQMGQIQNEADGLRVFTAFQPKFNSLAASTPPGAFQTQIQTVANDLNTIVAYVKANPHMSKPAPAAFDAELNTFQNDIDTVDNNCDPLGTSTS
ncbi:hypothetical protein KDK95_15830 [Actinospica sp. MGRD01-02]|uniref:Uncharacterized protein n=1 Tax=Actinospica acidithermotolerans TaxID=2828514 RepID=A0A941IHZ9_9ACTN|nr:hypothetical protein [Actinospica acidithermotolerans]MBR7827789.1 hypothetical protein [Actinospica acidithermotolerans]